MSSVKAFAFSTSGETGELGRCVFCCAALCGDGLAVGRAAVDELPPNPMNVHQRTMIATSPSAAAQMNFFFSPGLLRSTNGISIYSRTAEAFSVALWRWKYVAILS